MPICQTPYFSADERIVLLQLQAGQRYSDLDVWVEPYGGEKNVSTDPIRNRGIWDFTARSAFRQHSYVSDVKIGKLEEPVTLVLSSYNATIVSLSGYVENVNRVVVLGSRAYGYGAIGVAGIEAYKVEHVPVIGRDEGRQTICSAPGQSCSPIQFFDFQDPEYFNYAYKDMEPYQNLRPVSAFSAEYINAKGELKTISGFQDVYRINILEGADSPKIELDKTHDNITNEVYSLEQYKAARAKYGDYGIFLDTRLDIVSDIDPEMIISPFNFQKADQLPGWYGLETLRDEGALLLRTDPEFQQRYDSYVEASDEWGDDKKLRMDVILLRDIEVLPRSLRDAVHMIVIFIPDGVTMPKIPKNSRACFLFETPPAKVPGVYLHPCSRGNLLNRY